MRKLGWKSILKMILLITEEYFLGIIKKDQKISKINEEEIHVLIEERNLARANKDFKKSDEIRNKLEIMGIRLKDMENGTVWEQIE